jgi:hypothetical protein
VATPTEQEARRIQWLPHRWCSFICECNRYVTFRVRAGARRYYIQYFIITCLIVLKTDTDTLRI